MNETLNTVKALVNEASFDCTPVVINKEDHIFVPMSRPAHWPVLANGISSKTANKVAHNYIQVGNTNYLVFSMKPTVHAGATGQAIAAFLDGESYRYTHQKVGNEDIKQDLFLIPARPDAIGHMIDYLKLKLSAYSFNIGATKIEGTNGVFITITTKLTNNEPA